MKNEERNISTGLTQKQHSNDVLNPLTGQYRKADDSDDIEKKKNETKWPTISNVERD